MRENEIVERVDHKVRHCYQGHVTIPDSMDIPKLPRRKDLSIKSWSSFCRTIVVLNYGMVIRTTPLGFLKANWVPSHTSVIRRAGKLGSVAAVLVDYYGDEMRWGVFRTFLLCCTINGREVPDASEILTYYHPHDIPCQGLMPRPRMGPRYYPVKTLGHQKSPGAAYFSFVANYNRRHAIRTVDRCLITPQPGMREEKCQLHALFLGESTYKFAHDKDEEDRTRMEVAHNLLNISQQDDQVEALEAAAEHNIGDTSIIAETVNNAVDEICSLIRQQRDPDDWDEVDVQKQASDVHTSENIESPQPQASPVESKPFVPAEPQQQQQQDLVLQDQPQEDNTPRDGVHQVIVVQDSPLRVPHYQTRNVTRGVRRNLLPEFEACAKKRPHPYTSKAPRMTKCAKRHHGQTAGRPVVNKKRKPNNQDAMDKAAAQLRPLIIRLRKVDMKLLQTDQPSLELELQPTASTPKPGSSAKTWKQHMAETFQKEQEAEPISIPRFAIAHPPEGSSDCQDDSEEFVWVRLTNPPK